MEKTLEFEFEELSIRIDEGYEHGIMLYGKATLIEDGDDGFFVDEIMLAGGTILRKHNHGMVAPDKFKDKLFKRICDIIMDGHTDIGKAAELAWSDAEPVSMEKIAYSALGVE